MTDPSPLLTWRQTAAQDLVRLITSLPDESLGDHDSAVDDLLRSLGKQAPRASDRQPYQGLFPEAPVPELRQRAAAGIKVFIDHLKEPNLTPQDEKIDALVRSLQGLPPRPAPLYPYEATYSVFEVKPEVLKTWRGRAAAQLQYWLTKKITADDLTDKDGVVDNLLRTLGGQAPRPPARKPYEGLFPPGMSADLRQRAASGIKVFIDHLKDPNVLPVDALLDQSIRVLGGLPPRPFGRVPYAGFFPASTIPEVTFEQLRAIAPYGSESQLRRLLPHLNATMAEFEINTRLRQAHFLAQVAHESGEFNYVEEIASGSAYEGRSDLGNTQPGDGVRFKGRGLIQVTGRFNYEDASKALGVDLISQPTRLADDDLAARSAGWYWNREKLNAIADQDDARAITRKINGGYNGLDDRLNKLDAAKRVFGI